MADSQDEKMGNVYYVWPRRLGRVIYAHIILILLVKPLAPQNIYKLQPPHGSHKLALLPYLSTSRRYGLFSFLLDTDALQSFLAGIVYLIVSDPTP